MILNGFNNDYLVYFNNDYYLDSNNDFEPTTLLENFGKSLLKRRKNRYNHKSYNNSPKNHY